MKLLPLCTVLFASVAAASPGMQPPLFGLNGQPSPFTLAGREVDRPAIGAVSPKARKILQLRTQALKLRQADGGTLSAEHYDLLQAKLDAIHAAY